MIDMIHAANPLVGKEIITSSMPLGVQAFLNATLVVAILAVAASGVGIGVRLMLRGCRATFRACITIAALAGVLCGHYGDQFGLNFVGAALAITAAIVAICLFARGMEKQAELRVAMSADLANYLLGRFDSLAGGKDYIARTDLIVALTRGSFYHDDIFMLSLALQDMHLIGHPVDASHIHAPAMMGGGGAIVVHYGISRDDLISWEERVSKKFAEDFVHE